MKISDFGIAVSIEQVGSVTQSGQFVGTIDYLAPEQRHRLEIDERADQFSLAVLAYEMLTGHKPLGIFKRPSEHNPRLARRVDEAILRGLQRDPEDRYATVEEFRNALDAALSNVPNCRRHWWPSTLTATIALSIVAGSVVWFQTRPVPQENVSLAGQRAVADSQRDTQEHHPPATAEAPPLATTSFTPDEARHNQQRWASSLAVPVIETNFVGIEMVLVPPGDFVMGSSQEERTRLLRLREERNWPTYWDARFRSEVPQHKVKITKPFYLGAAEVTVGHFRRFGEATGYQTDAEMGRTASGRIQGKWVRRPEFSWRNMGDFEPSDDYPVVNVSYHDAVAFCRWLSENEQEVYRLPSEAEWEYACRAGTLGRWCVGDEDRLLGSFAWYGPNSDGKPHAVGQKSPNGFGLFDMHGNVWEWCSDRFGVAYYKSSPLRNPNGPSSGRNRVLRGGALYHNRFLIRSAVRHWAHPGNRYYHIGFRVARTLRPPRLRFAEDRQSELHAQPN